MSQLLEHVFEPAVQHLGIRCHQPRWVIGRASRLWAIFFRSFSTNPLVHRRRDPTDQMVTETAIMHTRPEQIDDVTPPGRPASWYLPWLRCFCQYERDVRLVCAQPSTSGPQQFPEQAMLHVRGCGQLQEQTTLLVVELVRRRVPTSIVGINTRHWPCSGPGSTSALIDAPRPPVHLPVGLELDDEAPGAWGGVSPRCIFKACTSCSLMSFN